MQAFGVGLPELLLIMVIAVLVVGPDRLPQVAADIAKWVKKARAYAQVVSREWDVAVKELEAETGTSRDELTAIARDLQGETKAIEKDLAEATADARKATEEARSAAEAADRPVAPTNGRNGAAKAAPAANAGQPEAIDEDDEEELTSIKDDEKPALAEGADDETWFQPGRARTRRRVE
jgi:Tat protein translocase TatB subunit